MFYWLIEVSNNLPPGFGALRPDNDHVRDRGHDENHDPDHGPDGDLLLHVAAP